MGFSIFDSRFWISEAAAAGAGSFSPGLWPLALGVCGSGAAGPSSGNSGWSFFLAGFFLAIAERDRNLYAEGAESAEGDWVLAAENS